MNCQSIQTWRLASFSYSNAKIVQSMNHQNCQSKRIKSVLLRDGRPFLRVGNIAASYSANLIHAHILINSYNIPVKTSRTHTINKTSILLYSVGHRDHVKLFFEKFVPGPKQGAYVSLKSDTCRCTGIPRRSSSMRN